MLTAEDVRERQPPADSSIVCSMCQRLFREAVKTPCCNKTYCEECVQTFLLERDFQCPGCGAKIPSLDKLVMDKPTRTRVNDYIDKEIKEYMKSVERFEDGDSSSRTGTPVQVFSFSLISQPVLTRLPRSLARPATEQQPQVQVRQPTRHLPPHKTKTTPSNNPATTRSPLNSPTSTNSKPKSANSKKSSKTHSLPTSANKPKCNSKSAKNSSNKHKWSWPWQHQCRNKRIQR